MFDLRPYQVEAVEALYRDANSGICGVGVLPTGAGKTVILRAIIELWLRDHPGHQILLLAHRTRLLTQAKARFKGIPTQVISAGMGLREQPEPGSVTVASIQTVMAMSDGLPKDWDLVLVDEAHRVGEEGQYAEYLRDLPNDPAIMGMTATPWRFADGRHQPIWGYTPAKDAGKSLSGRNSLFQRPSCWVYPETLIEQGFLLRPEIVPVRYGLPRTGVQMSHGEFAVANVSKYLQVDFAKRIQEIREKTKGCQHVLIFCNTIDDAEAMTEALIALKEKSVVLHGAHSELVRNAEIERFRAGDFRYLVNVDVFTEGLDVPEIDAVVLLRMTESVSRYLQMAGRGLRPDAGGEASSKASCKILDFGHHVERLGLIEARRGRNAMPVHWRCASAQRTFAENGNTDGLAGGSLAGGSHADGNSLADGNGSAPAFIEQEAEFCLRVRDLLLLPITARDGKRFLLMRFSVDKPEDCFFRGIDTKKHGSISTIRMELKVHESDRSLRELRKRWQILSGSPVGSSLACGSLAAVLPGQGLEQLLAMGHSKQGFLPYMPYAVRVRWSGRSGRWMVDGWQWNGSEKKMQITAKEEQALNAWIQKTARTDDPTDQSVREVLYRMSRSGVLDLSLEKNPSNQPRLADGSPADGNPAGCNPAGCNPVGRNTEGRKSPAISKKKPLSDAEIDATLKGDIPAHSQEPSPQNGDAPGVDAPGGTVPGRDAPGRDVEDGHDFLPGPVQEWVSMPSITPFAGAQPPAGGNTAWQNSENLAAPTHSRGNNGHDMPKGSC